MNDQATTSTESVDETNVAHSNTNGRILSPSSNSTSENIPPVAPASLPSNASNVDGPTLTNSTATQTETTPTTPIRPSSFDDLLSDASEDTLHEIFKAPVHIHELYPSTIEMLATVTPTQRRNIFGERLYPKVAARNSTLAPKITGMFLELSDVQILYLLDRPDTLTQRVREAEDVLREHEQWIAAVNAQSELEDSEAVQAAMCAASNGGSSATPLNGEINSTCICNEDENMNLSEYPLLRGAQVLIQSVLGWWRTQNQ